MEIATGFRASLKKSGEEETDTNKEELLEENLQEGMEFSRIQAEADRHFTSPPKAFTEDTLLMAMETAGNKEFDAETEKKGLGTPATRAAVIEKLVSSGYAPPQRKTDTSNSGWKSIDGSDSNVSEICRHDSRMGEPPAFDRKRAA